jgi:hypothetical protein
MGESYLVIPARIKDANPESRDSGFDAEPVIGPRLARTRWHRPGMTTLDCFVAEFIIGPAEGGTRWLLAMTALQIQNVTPRSRGAMRPSFASTVSPL